MNQGHPLRKPQARAIALDMPVQNARQIMLVKGTMALLSVAALVDAAWMVRIVLQGFAH